MEGGLAGRWRLVDFFGPPAQRWALMSDEVLVPTVEVSAISEDPERGYGVARATQEVAARAAKARMGWYDRTAVERAREVVAHVLYCAGLDQTRIVRTIQEGPASVYNALGGRNDDNPQRSAPLVVRHLKAIEAWAALDVELPTVAQARTAVKRMLAVVEHSRDGKAWYFRRDQHVAELNEIKALCRDSGDYDAALKAMGAVARIEGFDAPQKSVQIHGHAMIGPNTTTTLPDGPGVVAGISVSALRAMGRDGREALVKLLGIAEVARAELPPGSGDDEYADAVDAEIVDER